MRELSNHRSPGDAGASVLGPSPRPRKKFYPWFFQNDTPQWKRAAARFLGVITALLALVALIWWLW